MGVVSQEETKNEEQQKSKLIGKCKQMQTEQNKKHHTQQVKVYMNIHDKAGNEEQNEMKVLSFCVACGVWERN